MPAQHQITLFPEAQPSSAFNLPPRAASFVPRVIASAPPAIVAMPEKTEAEKIAKAKALMRWLMANYRTAFSFSGGKDSSCTLGLAMAAAADLAREGIAVQRFVILTADTLVENPNVHSVTRDDLERIRAWIKRHNLPGSVHVARPNLAAEFAVNVIGGRSLPSTAQTKRDCTTDWKSSPIARLRKQVLGTNDIDGGKFVVSVTGVRSSESQQRASNMALRGESPVAIVNTNPDGNVAIAPIANWTWDDVFSYLGLAKNGMEKTYSDFADVIRVYREAMGECVITGSDDDVKASRPCSARTGCWTCLMVAEDASMDQMLEEPANAYMRPLAKLRRFLANTFYDLERRTWVGRTIDKNGYIRFAPDGYSPAMLYDLLRYALTIQFEEAEAAAAIGIRPRFTIISIEALIAIDAVWSLQGFALPFTALKIYRDVLRGARYPVPDVPVFPKVPIPKPRYIHVGSDWDQGEDWIYTGLRDPLMDAFAGESGCIGTRTVKSRGKVKIVMDVNDDDLFQVDAEGASLFLEFEMDRYVDDWHGRNAKPLAWEGHHVTGVGYRTYVRFGIISLSKGHVGRTDEILRRTAYRERLGLAGYHYDHARALAMSVEAPVPIQPDASPPTAEPAPEQGETMASAGEPETDAEVQTPMPVPPPWAHPATGPSCVIQPGTA